MIDIAAAVFWIINFDIIWLWVKETPIFIMPLPFQIKQ